ncbi:tannase/feruloyl esterase family alpha/beta hydrolase [Alteraurantiacibacter palmitatis]|uniref:Tannase/feruloyl esterase family alpha/beta hydrolase n=1 Tax=Alteraurantiacibacter palmitatis TaxID=2054628 RepID=A0ABV7E364_9SPHN
MQLKSVLAAASSIAVLAIAAPALAACEDLAGMPIEGGRVTSAEVVNAGGFVAPANPFGPPPGIAASPFADVPAFCRVQLTLTPTSDSDITSEVWLPLTGWNGKYVGVGNGIWAGSLSYTEMGRNVVRSYATAATDTGHTGNGLTAEWAIGHPEKLVDFGHRAVHLTTVAAKAVVERFYGRAPTRSYWNSCSTGGRQGLMAAYRYPDDFDAISAMAPANPMTDLMTQTMWQGWQPQRFGAAITPQVLGAVHAEVIRQCDALDGLADGLVGNPLQCRFDLSRVDLTPEQRQAMAHIYGGVRDNAGNLLLPGWPYGSEMQLAALVMGQEPFPVAMSYFRDLVYYGREDWNWRTTDYADYVRDGAAYGAGILNVPHDGLAAFFARGGKLLLSHGWNDGLIPATNTLAFHHSLYNALPAAQRDAQLRLFMAPGMDHCSGGEGPSVFDTLGAIDAWSTTGTAPERLIATRPTQGGGGMPGGPPAPPREPMERPLCAWPLQAVYDGVGNPAVASSFQCRMGG